MPEWAHHQGLVPRSMQSSGQWRLSGSNVTTRVRNTVRAPARNSARNRRETLAGEATLRRVRDTARARAGCTARTRSTREWTTAWQTTKLQRQGTRGQHRSGTRRWQRQSECGWHRQKATPGRVRIAPMKLDRPIVRVLPVHNDGVSRYQA